MKLMILFILTALYIHTLLTAHPFYTTKTETMWKDLSSCSHAHPDERWVLVAKKTIRNRSNERSHLETFQIKWEPKNLKPLTPLTASLFVQHNERDPFTPTQDHFLCTGSWNPQQKSIQFTLAKPYPIKAIETFYVVLTLPRRT